MKLRLIQWCVKIQDGAEMGMFTPAPCDEEMATAIATATFGSFVSLANEGIITQTISDDQLARVAEGVI